MILLIALSLSMDAFSLALAYGTNKIANKIKYTLSIIVGLFHFIMPIIGYFIGTIIMQIIKIKPNIIVSIILTFIGINMCITKKEKLDPLKSIIEDSFSVGLGLKAITNNIYKASSIFSITAGIITYLGLILGHKISQKVGHLAPTLGGIFLILIGLLYIFK